MMTTVSVIITAYYTLVVVVSTAMACNKIIASMTYSSCEVTCEPRSS